MSAFSCILFVLDITGILWRVMYPCWILILYAHRRIKILFFFIFLIFKIHFSQNVKFRKKNSQEMPAGNLHMATVITTVSMFLPNQKYFTLLLGAPPDFHLWHFPGPLFGPLAWCPTSHVLCTKHIYRILSNGCSFVIDYGYHVIVNWSLIRAT